MIKILTFCFDKWWKPVLVFGLTALILVLCELTDEPILHNFSFYLFIIGFLGLLISTVFQFAKRRWLPAIFTTILIAISIVALFIYAVVLILNESLMPDNYADNLKIPTNIIINDPLNQPKPSEMDFFIYKSLQPGLYQYVFWTKRIDKGIVYLKAYEITQNDPLSEDRFKERSTIFVLNQTDSLIAFEIDKGYSELGRPFTIYEGDWGKPYAARFELWFAPDNGGKEQKLLEKNYKIEGWQH